VVTLAAPVVAAPRRCGCGSVRSFTAPDSAGIAPVVAMLMARLAMRVLIWCAAGAIVGATRYVGGAPPEARAEALARSGRESSPPYARR